MEEETLDPKNWDEFRTTGNMLLGDVVDHLSNLSGKPVWRSMPGKEKLKFNAALPREETDLASVYNEIKEDLFKYQLGNVHPRFWGWVAGSGDPVGVLADFLASATNSNVFAGDQIGAHMEAQVLEWCKTMLGLDSGTDGILTSSCAVSNLICLAIARDEKLCVDRTGGGLFASPGLPVLYSSAESHNSIQKSAHILGLGEKSLRKVPTKNHKLDPAALAEMIDADLKESKRPFCIVANVGSVNCGAIDDLDAIAEIAQKYRLWLHIDGAFGIWARLLREYDTRLKGVALADSIAFDFHKWMYAPYAVACAMTRHPQRHKETFTVPGPYLRGDERGVMAKARNFGDYGIELGRDFRALKLWMALKVHGADKFSRLIRQNIDQARYLGKIIEESKYLELVTDIELNVVCFRAIAEQWSNENIDELNREIVLRLQESGVAVVSSTTIRDRFAIRAAITNHRSRLSDFEILRDKILEIRAVLVAARG